MAAGWVLPVTAAQAPLTALDIPYIYETRVEYTKIAIPPRSVLCSCVLYAKWYLGRSAEFWGTARYIKPDTTEPAMGRAVLLDEGINGHVAVIVKIENDLLYIVEANYKPCQAGTRVIRTDYSRIRGYKI